MLVRIMPYERLYDVERELREVATQLQQLPGYPNYTYEQARKLITRVEELLTSAQYEIVEDREHPLLTEEERKKLRDLADWLADVMLDIHYYLKEPTDEMWKEGIDRRLRFVEESVKGLTGRPCRFGIVSPAGVVNDLSSCIHRAADYLYEKIGTAEEKGKCILARDASKEVKEACEAWDGVTEALNDEGLYADDDYASLRGTGIDDRLMLRVGSATGHATHLDLEKGSLEYYDTDEDVNVVMEKLWEDVGLDCSRHEWGISCRGLNRENIRKAAMVAAAATSMDFRRRRPATWWSEEREPQEQEVIEEEIAELRRRQEELLRMAFATDLEATLRVLGT